MHKAQPFFPPFGVTLREKEREEHYRDIKSDVASFPLQRARVLDILIMPSTYVHTMQHAESIGNVHSSRSLSISIKLLNPLSILPSIPHFVIYKFYIRSINLHLCVFCDEKASFLPPIALSPAPQQCYCQFRGKPIKGIYELK
jgi:hypothetical protein